MQPRYVPNASASAASAASRACSTGPRPASDYIFEMTADLTVHAWDLAQATGGDTELDGQLVTAALVYADRLPPEGVPGIIGAPLDVADAASPQVRLLARFGRKA